MLVFSTPGETTILSQERMLDDFLQMVLQTQLLITQYSWAMTREPALLIIQTKLLLAQVQLEAVVIV
ncbi:MAG: hypothetical protein DDT19_01817 [Syntrophomonadaceae bacterium]|nr:hypothetical protein [Bacillota bacterium]